MKSILASNKENGLVVVHDSSSNIVNNSGRRPHVEKLDLQTHFLQYPLPPRVDQVWSYSVVLGAKV